MQNRRVEHNRNILLVLRIENYVKMTQYHVDMPQSMNTLLRLANTRPQPYNIRTCLQQLHDLSKVLHNTHLIIIKLKQKFLFSFRIHMKRVRDLTPAQRLQLAPLFVAQEKYCRQLLTYHEILDPGQSEIKTKILQELRKILLMQIRVLADNPTSTREEMADKLDEVKSLSFLVCERVPL